MTFDEFEIVSSISENEKSKSKDSWINTMMTAADEEGARFALCLKIGTAEDLHLHTISRLLPDEKAAAAGYLRVIDESGEDYLYPAEYFLPLDLPAATTEAILAMPARH